MKNTLLKLIAVLALCFVICGVLVACGGSGEKGADGQTPYIGTNGNWWIGNTDTGVQAQGKPGDDGKDATAVECKHENFTEWVLLEHTKENDGKYLKVCDDCGYAWAIEEQRHDYVLKDEFVPATCTEASFKGYQCYCGAIDPERVEYAPDSEPLGHDLTDWSYVAAEGENICTHGGIKAHHCKRCDFKEVEAVAPTDHQVAEWTVQNDALLTKTGLLTGTCDFCGLKGVEFKLPVLSENDYTIETVAAECSKEGSYTYTLKNDTVKYSVVLNTPKAGHILNGQNYLNYQLEGYDKIVLPYWVGDLELNIDPFADTPFACSDAPQAGHFRCEACDEIVPVNVLYNHHGATTVVKDATCTELGSMKVNCDNCSEEEAVLPIAITHNYEYKLTEAGVLVGTCKCGATDSVQTNVLDNVAKDLTAPTCLAAGNREYTYVYTVGAKYYIETRELVVGKTSHTILHNGEYVLAETVVNDDGSFNHNIAGIKPFADVKFETCGETYEGYYICKVCQDLGAEDYVVDVDVYRVHIPAGEPNVVNPTCTTPGSKTFECADCKAKVDGEVIPALGHTDGNNKDKVEPSYVVVPNVAGDGYVLLTICSRECCTGKCCDDTDSCGVDAKYHVIKSEDVAEYEEKVTKEATCTEEGELTITVTLANGAHATYVTKLAKTAHTLNGLTIDHKDFAKYVKEVVGNKYTLLATTPNIQKFADSEFKCEQTVEGCFTCEVCEQLVGIGVYQDHKFDENDPDAVKPTCLTPGSSVCTNCGEDQVIKALNHNYSVKITNLVAPTATVPGSFHYVAECSACAEEIKNHKVEGDGVLPVLGDAGYDIVHATANCVKGGEDKYTFAFEIVDAENVKEDGSNYSFDVNFIVEVDAVGHVGYVQGTDKVIKFVKDGKWYEVYVCSRCGGYNLIKSGDVE